MCRDNDINLVHVAGRLARSRAPVAPLIHMQTCNAPTNGGGQVALFSIFFCAKLPGPVRLQLNGRRAEHVTAALVF